MPSVSMWFYFVASAQDANHSSPFRTKPSVCSRSWKELMWGLFLGGGYTPAFYNGEISKLPRNMGEYTNGTNLLVIRTASRRMPLVPIAVIMNTKGEFKVWVSTKMTLCRSFILNCERESFDKLENAFIVESFYSPFLRSGIHSIRSSFAPIIFYQ